MRDEDIGDPRVVPRWVEAGVSGVPRGRDWDAVAVVDLPELEGSLASELSFRVQWPGMPQATVLRTIRLLGEKVLPKLS